MANIRPTRIERSVSGYAEGSALITAGRTKVLVTASVVPEVPAFLKGTPSGWITAEYGMLPRSTKERKPRLDARGRADGRALEIQRLVGRALRQVAEVGYLASHTIYIDCDVLEADGGTRVASVNAGVVALVEALVWMKRKGIIPGVPAKTLISAASVAKASGTLILDPDYQVDSTAEMDMNAVFTESGELVEIQATAERVPANQETFLQMVGLAREGASQALQAIRAAIGDELLAEAGFAAA